MNANLLPKRATVHEKTVQRAAELAEAADAKVHSIRSGYQHRTVIHRVKVDPRVWEAALALADGDALRIAVVHSTEIIVLNNPQKGNRHHVHA